MKSILSLLFIAITSLTFANNPIKETKTVDVIKSEIKWVGKKVLGSHDGQIKLQSGELQFEKGKLIGGTLIIDMNTITCTDLQGDTADKLVGHLNSDDFFGVSDHPTARLSIIKVTPKDGNVYTIDANATIKGITQAIQFDAIVGDNSATATISIDRTKHNIKYGSGSFFDNLGDKTIYDEFEMQVDLRF